MPADFCAAFNQLADTFQQLASDAHKRRIDPLVRDTAYSARSGGRLILDAHKAGALPDFARWYDPVYGDWTFGPHESPEQHTWTFAITLWLSNDYKSRLPEHAGVVDHAQWKRREGAKPTAREWTDDDGTRHFESKWPDDSLEIDGSLFGQFKHDEQDAIERTYQRLIVYAAAARLLAELVTGEPDSEPAVELPKQPHLKPSEIIYWSERRYASRRTPDIPGPEDGKGDKLAYDWLCKHGAEDGAKPGGRGGKHEPLEFRSWSRAVRAARAKLFPKPEPIPKNDRSIGASVKRSRNVR